MMTMKTKKMKKKKKRTKKKKMMMRKDVAAADFAIECLCANYSAMLFFGLHLVAWYRKCRFLRL